MNDISARLHPLMKSILVFKVNRLKIAAGILISLLTIALCAFAEISLGKTCVFLLIFIVLSFVEFDCRAGIVKGLHTIWMLGAIPVSLMLTQLMMNNNLSYGIFKVLLGCLCCGVVLITAFVIFFNSRIAVTICIVSLLMLTTANYFVLYFRGCELAPADILAVGTALDVAGQYTYKISAPFVYAWLLGAAYCFTGWCFRGCAISRTIRRTAGCLCVECVVIVSLIFGAQGIEPQHFAQNGSAVNGFLLNFVLRYESPKVERPDDYSFEHISEYEEQYRVGCEETASSRAPDIIMIMCETFSDLRVVGDLRTTAEVMPFYDSLRENTVRGHAVASVFGGGHAILNMKSCPVIQ